MNRNNFIEDYTRINRRLETQFMPLVEKVIRRKASEVIGHLKTAGIESAASHLHTDVGNENLTNIIRTLYSTTGVTHARLNYSRLLHDGRKDDTEAKGFGFNAEWTQYIINYLREFLLEKITFNVAATTRDALLKILSVATIEGWSIDQTVDKLEGWPGARYQAARIVRTEVNRAANVGAMAQNETSKYQQTKEWIAVHDFRTRGQNPDDHASHIGLDGIKVNEGESFTDPRNKDHLMFPGDPKAKAESTINCRCSLGYEIKRDLNGEPLLKTTSVPMINQPKQLKTNSNNFTFDLDITDSLGDQLNGAIDVINAKLETFTGDINNMVNVIGVKNYQYADTLQKEITFLKSKNYTPTIVNQVSTDVQPFNSAIEALRLNIIDILQSIVDDIRKPKKFMHEIQRDKNELIKTIITTEI